MFRHLAIAGVAASILALGSIPASAQVVGGLQVGPVSIGVGTYSPGYYTYAWPFAVGGYYGPGWYGGHYWEGGVWRGQGYYRSHGYNGYRYRQAHQFAGGNRGGGERHGHGHDRR